MKQLRLHDRHLSLGARWKEIAGWQVPANYGDVLDEYQTVRRAAGIADLSHRGRCRITGEDRVKWPQSVISNDLLSLKPGQSIYSSLLTHKGKMLTYFRVLLLPDAVMLEDVGDIGEYTFQSLRKFLLYGTQAKLHNCTESWGSLLLSGPQAPAVIQSAWGLDVGDLKPLAFLTQELSEGPALILRSEETGECDLEILAAAEALPAVWDHLWNAGQGLGLKPIGADARDILRLEAGLPQAGADLTEEIVPPEANLEGKAFSLTKGCYPGQEVVARMDTYGSVRRRLVGLTLDNPAVPPKGAKLFSGDREVGWVSSAAPSPLLGCPIAFGFPLRDFGASGTKLTVEVNGQRIHATVRPLPFYEKET
jgi:folate-binding protein YgfZ